MSFSFYHCNINVLDLDKSIDFYQKALGLHEQRRKSAKDGSFTLVFLTDYKGTFSLELTCLHDRVEPYDLGDNESHIAFIASDFEEAKKLHAEMGCICFENESIGVYFIEDPDGYWIEIVPER